jgi:GxxExxY protein
LNRSRLNEITGAIVDAAIKVHKVLGPGLLESAYEKCLEYELQKRGFQVKRQVDMPLVYEDLRLDLGYRIDMLVEVIVVVECKAVRELTPIDKAQILSHIKLNNFPVGLLVNFHEQLLKDGIHRFVN